MKSGYRLAVVLSILALPVTASHVRSDTAEAPPPATQYPSHIFAGHTAPPGGVLTNPFEGDTDMATTGADLFVSMNCNGCHGDGALGFAAPSLADGRWRYGDSEQSIFQSIYYGRPKGMPAFGGLVGTDGIWILVTYLKSLPVSDNKTESWETQ